MLSDLNTGDHLFLALWGWKNEYHRPVMVYDYEIVKLTPSGYHLRLSAEKRGSAEWVATKDHKISGEPFERWVGHNTRQFFPTMRESIDRLIDLRTRRLGHLNHMVRQVEQDIKCLQNSELTVPNHRSIVRLNEQFLQRTNDRLS